MLHRMRLKPLNHSAHKGLLVLRVSFRVVQHAAAALFSLCETLIQLWCVPVLRHPCAYADTPCSRGMVMV